MAEKTINYRTAILIFLIGCSLLVIILLRLNKSPSTFSLPATLSDGKPAPDFSLPGLDGKQINLSDYRGKVVLVNIWATWCLPCVEEMPSMQKLYNEFKGNDFEILAISIDTLGLKVVAPFMKNHKLTFPALLDPQGTVKSTYGITGVPESFIIGKDGTLVKKIIGPLDWATPAVFQFFRDLIQNSSHQSG
jgi:peroxiredoxin